MAKNATKILFTFANWQCNLCVIIKVIFRAKMQRAHVIPKEVGKLLKKRVLLIVVLSAALLALYAFVFIKKGEPTYKGHSLSYWLDATPSDESKSAVLAIGTNAIPYLLEWLTYNPPA